MMAVACLLATASVANLLANGGFDAADPKAGWNVPQDGHWRFEERTGVGGSRCLVWDSPEQCPKTLCSVSIPAEPGCVYKVSARINVESVKTGEWSFGVDWSSTDGKWISNSGTTRRTDNHPSVADGWVKYEGGTPPLPSNVGTLRVYCYAKSGASGRVRFDDFTVEKSGSRAVEYLVSSAYHDAATHGPVKLFARVCFNPLRYALSDLVGEFAFLDAKGQREVRRTALVSSELAVCTIAAEDLAPGRHPIVFSLKTARGETLGTETLDFTHEVEPTPRKVWVDEQRFAVVDGKRFFPIGVYTHFMTPEQFDFYARGPFNCVKLSNHGVSRAWLDEFQRRGLRVVIDIRDEIKVITADPSADKAKGRAALKKTILAWKGHPAVLAWYNCDEAPLSILPDIRLATKWVHEFDPDHPTYAVTDKPNQTRAFLSAYDIVGMDPYPVGNLSGMNDIGIASRWAEACREGMFDTRAMWQVPQMFDWGWYANGRKTGVATRLPTKAEFASMCWQAIAGGANGLFGYCFYDFYGRQDPEARDRVWQDYCDVLAKIRKAEPILLSDPSPVRVTDVPKDLAVRAWRRNGQDWILFANRTDRPVAATVTAGGRHVPVNLKGLGFTMMRLQKSE